MVMHKSKETEKEVTNADFADYGDLLLSPRIYQNLRKRIVFIKIILLILYMSSTLNTKFNVEMLFVRMSKE